MRAREIILELREYMDRTKYGCWVDAKTDEIHYVEEMGHEDFVETLLRTKYHASKDQIDNMTGMSKYKFAFNDHYVRVEFNSRDAVSIQGITEDIKEVSFILLATCVQPDVNIVFVDKMNNASSGDLDEEEFDMPADRRALMMYLKNETE